MNAGFINEKTPYGDADVQEAQKRDGGSPERAVFQCMCVLTGQQGERVEMSEIAREMVLQSSQ